MNKGIYIALSGAIQKQHQLDTLTQNMANVNTKGYKRERLSFKDYMVPTDNQKSVESSGRIMTDLSKRTIDFSNGPIVKTDNPLDIAINGEGFFALEGDRFTRSGAFSLDSQGNIITQSGIKVLGDGGPIAIEGSKVDVTPSGEIIVDDVSVGSLRVVDFEDKTVLNKVSGGVFATEETPTDITPDLSQGYVENSNVDAVRELIEVVSAQREFETYQKLIRNFDEATGRVINEMGK